MRRLALAALMAASLAAVGVPTNAASPTDNCEPEGTYVKAGPDSTCTTSTKPGKNNGGVKDETTTTGPGNSPNKTEETCRVNGGGEHC
jgi:hypothetical protein